MRRLALLTSALLVLAACGTQPSGTSTVAVQMTDAPATEADHLYVDFGRIELMPASESEDGVQTVAEEGGRIDVLTLTNGTVEDLGEIEVPAGTYHQVRIIVEDAQVHFGEDSFDVKVPSGAQTGLKVNIDPPLVAAAGTTNLVTLDFDASRAVIETPPGSGNYLLKPTGIRAVSEAGLLLGSVADAATTEAIAGATVDVLDQDGVGVTTAVTEEDGSFRIVTLPTGVYDLEVAAEGYVTHLEDDVEVTAGAVTDLGVLELDPVAPLVPATP